MKYYWITIALEHGGVLQVDHSKHGFRAEMEWPWKNSVCSDITTNLPDALTSLNAALQDDAADECHL